MTGREPWSVPRERVAKVEVHELKVLATVFAVGIPLAALGVVVGMAVALQGWGSD